MARYTFAKFGSRIEDPRWPLYEGDSEDEDHFYWTEVWSCGFGLTAAERTGTGEDEEPEEKKPKPKLNSVTLTKKVDWGSTSLFQKCCEAPEALKVRSDEDSDVPGRIDDITIEVLREAGAKLPYLILKYTKCFITAYGIDIGGPDPTENITFEYEKVEFEYIATDPHTGQPMQDGSCKATGMEWHEDVDPQSSNGGTPTPGAAAAAGAGTGMGAGAGGAGGANSGGGAAATPGGASTVDAAVSANYPGALSQNGYGLLPD